MKPREKPFKRRATQEKSDFASWAHGGGVLPWCIEKSALVTQYASSGGGHLAEHLCATSKHIHNVNSLIKELGEMPKLLQSDTAAEFWEIGHLAQFLSLPFLR